MAEQRRRRSWLRTMVIDDLHRNGPVIEPKGRAVIVLAERIGHDSALSVGNVVRQLHLEGNAIRITAKNGATPIDRDGQPSTHAKRTYHIALTDEFIATLPPIVDPEPEPAAEQTATELEQPPADAAPAETETFPGSIHVPEGLDYETFRDLVMVSVWEGLDCRAKYIALVEQHEKTKAALADATDTIETLRAELKAERNERGRIEDEATNLWSRIEDLEYKAKVGGRNNGWDKAPVDGVRLLERLMQQPPKNRG